MTPRWKTYSCPMSARLPCRRLAPPKIIRRQDCAFRLAASGAIGDTAMDYHEVARFAAGYLLAHYSASLCKRYNLEQPPEDAEQLLAELGRRRGCLGSGGIIDLHRAAEIFLRELQGGRIGRISFESPEEGLENTGLES